MMTTSRIFKTGTGEKLVVSLPVKVRHPPARGCRVLELLRKGDKKTLSGSQVHSAGGALPVLMWDTANATWLSLAILPRGQLSTQAQQRRCRRSSAPWCFFGLHMPEEGEFLFFH